WTQHTDADIPDFGLNGVYVASASVAFVVGDTDGVGGAGTLLYTTDLSNDNWSISADSAIPVQDLSGVDGVSTTHVWVSGAGDSMIETTDGSDWDTNTLPSNADLIRRISAESADHVYASCS